MSDSGCKDGILVVWDEGVDGEVWMRHETFNISYDVVPLWINLLKEIDTAYDGLVRLRMLEGRGNTTRERLAIRLAWEIITDKVVGIASTDYVLRVRPEVPGFEGFDALVMCYIQEKVTRASLALPKGTYDSPAPSEDPVAVHIVHRLLQDDEFKEYLTTQTESIVKRGILGYTQEESPFEHIYAGAVYTREWYTILTMIVMYLTDASTETEVWKLAYAYLESKEVLEHTN